MKKYCCSLLFILITVTAQSQQRASIKFGIKSGIAFSKGNVEVIDSANNFSSSGKTGIILGVFLDKIITQKFNFQLALQYVRKGYKENSFGYEYNNPISYLEFPLNILYALPSKNNRYYIGAGVSPALKLNNYAFRDEIKNVDVGLNLLAGFIIPIGFSFNLGYTKGLQNVSKNKDFIRRIENGYYSITIGYEF
jgi:Outer membrane protein beta-barrel domain